MVLAAGVGSRLDPLTSEIPKPLVPVAGVPVLQHILRLLSEHRFNDVCANLHYLPEKIESYFKTNRSLGLSLNFHREEKLSGDAGGVKACQSFLKGGTFIVVSGDLLTDANLTAIVEQHKKKRALASIAVKRVDDVTRFGVAVLNSEGFIVGFQEKPKAGEALSNFISTGIYVLEPEVFDFIPEKAEYGFGRQLFPNLVKQGLPVLGVELEGYWSDVGTIEQYRLSNFDALAGKVKLPMPGRRVSGGNQPMWLDEGARVEQDESVKGALMLGKNSIVKKGVIIEGTVVVGDNCVIDSGAQIADTVVWSGAQIGSQAQVSRCVIGSNCLVQPESKLADTAFIAAGLSQQELVV